MRFAEVLRRTNPESTKYARSDVYFVDFSISMVRYDCIEPRSNRIRISEGMIGIIKKDTEPIPR